MCMLLVGSLRDPGAEMCKELAPGVLRNAAGEGSGASGSV